MNPVYFTIIIFRLERKRDRERIHKIVLRFSNTLWTVVNIINVILPLIEKRKKHQRSNIVVINTSISTKVCAFYLIYTVHNDSWLGDLQLVVASNKRCGEEETVFFFENDAAIIAIPYYIRLHGVCISIFTCDLHTCFKKEYKLKKSTVFFRDQLRATLKRNWKEFFIWPEKLKSKILNQWTEHGLTCFYAAFKYLFSWNVFPSQRKRRE